MDTTAVPNSQQATASTKQSLYKYKINELLITKFGLNRSRKREDLAAHAGVTRQTLSADANILLSSRQEAPRARLIAYADFFKINMEDLINE